jgi:hypothetical protein
MLSTYRRPQIRRACWCIVIIVDTHEKLHTKLIREIVRLLHLRNIATPSAPLASLGASLHPSSSST